MDVGFIGLGAMGVVRLDALRGRMGEAVDAGLGERDWSVMADFTLRSRP